MDNVYDVAIVGAGPGGSNSAAVLLRGGLRVLQLDGATFPRVKPCGGGMTMKACRALQLALEPSVAATHDALESNLWRVRARRFGHRGGPILKMVVRADFDRHLVEQNQRWPTFTFRDGARVTDITYDGLFRLRTGADSFAARQLIGADGAYSLVAKTFGIARPRAFATAIELNLDRARCRTADNLVPCFDFGAIAQGYGWVFPRTQTLNVGLYTFARGLKGLRTQLLDYLAAKGITLAPATPLRFEAHQIPVGGFTPHVPPTAPVYVVGDAGGFADALTGEGIYHALESGRLAGITAVEHARGQGSYRHYYRRLWRAVLPDTLLTYALARAFYGHLNLSVRALQSPLLWRPLFEGSASGATFVQSLALGGYFQAASLVRHSLARESA